MGVRYCRVPTCKKPGGKQHNMPKDNERFKFWCQVIGREDLINLDINRGRNFRVCDEHFSADLKFVSQHNKTNLKVTAIPNVNLPVQTSVDQPEMEFLDIPGPSTSTQNLVVIIADEPIPINEKASTSSTPVNFEKSKFVVVDMSAQKSRKDKFRLLKEINVGRVNALTPKCKKLYKRATELKEII